MCRRLLLGLLASSALSACDPGPETSSAPELVVSKLPPASVEEQSPSDWIRAHYDKREVRIPMRDGVRLFTAIYTPKDDATPHPILMIRTPYSVRPYGEDEFPDKLGPSKDMLEDGYIHVYQDVRGRMMSEGEFVNMTPHVPDKGEDGSKHDESSDTYDTIEWLLANVENHNGKVGQWGISYPGFYAAAGMIDAHPALAAVSPQAPIADWWFDDFHHHGAFFLPHAFNFLAVFGRARPEPTTERGERFDHGTPDGYQFFLEMGSLRNANERYLKHEIAFWDDIVEHPNYDDYWQARNLLPHLHDVAPAVLTVGGWFDAEDLYGPLQIYRTIERQGGEGFNAIVMGPWQHGGWGRTDGERLGDVNFGAKTSVHYQQEIERRFFAHHLLGAKDPGLAEATMFETGTNQWRQFQQWPPETKSRRFYAGDEGRLIADEAPQVARAFDQWVSDPARPVPATEAIAKGMPKSYMTDDQRFASRRPDVMSYSTDVLATPMTLAGPITARLWVSTDHADADFVVKLIDVFPGEAEDHEGMRDGQHLGHYQMMVRSEVIRGRFRESYETPKRFPKGRPVEIELPLQDVLHTFGKGHRIMIQVQSTWFPIVDRNPQSWVDNIFLADDDDFEAATHRLYRERKHPTHIEVGELAH